ncbi:MAG TPA: zf-HC2 domain-containing protein [Gemmatimonadales bacterium]|nr:zf-HC2 domain-containing protein [Gemmatimonadales bacterium]
MRHIPEEELHAYLDQALSRSQCVEIEHHVSECVECRRERDAIAALRDRTTALLVTASPRWIRSRPYPQLAEVLLERRDRQRRWRRVAWAASLVGAVGLGWGVSRWQGADAVPPAAVATSPVPRADDSIQNASRSEPAPASTPSRALKPAGSTPIRPDGDLPRATQESAGPPKPVVPAPNGAELLASGDAGGRGAPVFDGVWRTVSWDGASESSGAWIPRVEGVPVVQVKVRQTPHGGRPLTVVTQQLASGEVISTVEGPAAEVASLLSRQPGQSAAAELQDLPLAAGTPEEASTSSGPVQSGAPRTLAIVGKLPPDSLKAFMLKVR